MNTVHATLLLCISGSLLCGAPQTNVRDAVNATRHQLQAQQEQLQILGERINNQDEIIESVRAKVSASKQPKKDPAQTRNKKELSSLSENLKELQNHATKTSSSLSKVGDHLNDLEKKSIEQEAQIQKLEQILKKLTLAIVEEEEKSYTVQHGDSLGEIALRNKISIKALKKKNNLKNDFINVGQKLLLP